MSASGKWRACLTKGCFRSKCVRDAHDYGIMSAGRGAGRIPCSLSVGCEDLGPEAVPTCSGYSAALDSVPFLAWMAQESPISGLRLLHHDMWWHHFNTENNTQRNVWLLWIYLIFPTTLPICFLCLWCCFLMHTHLKLLCHTAGLTHYYVLSPYSLVRSFVLKFIFFDTSVITPALFH